MREGLSPKIFSDDSGTVESALVLIPLLILALSTLQLASGVLGRQIAGNQVQSAVTQSGLYSPSALGAQAGVSAQGAGSPFDQMRSRGIGAATGLQLSGGGQLLIGEKRTQLPVITPLLPGGDSFASVGVTIGEGP